MSHSVERQHSNEASELLRWGFGPHRDWGRHCIHTCFTETAARAPSTPALVFGDQILTYAALEDRSSRLASRLRELGIGPGVVVGVCAQRSFQMWEAVLAIFKCGATCLPLDLSYPADWIAFVLDDSRCNIVLTYRQRPSTLSAEFKFDLQDESWRALAPLPSIQDPNQVIYVCYTSGSTGRPKGVMFLQRALINIVHAQREQMPVPDKPWTLQFASLNFDVSFHETFFTWLAGGTVFLIDEADRKNPERLIATINSHRIDTVFMPPSMLRLMAENVHDGNAPRSLRNIVVSGERLEISPAVQELHVRLPELDLHNHYGSNESHVVTTEILRGSEGAWPTFPLAGTPVANTSTHVLDNDMHLVPVGVAGEAYLGGAGLALGYINQPDLTKERFIPNPFGPPGSLLYRSGDIVRWCANGMLEYLGRADQQIKIHGYRVELGEIEAILLAQREIAEAVVAAAERTPGERYLVAYVVKREGRTLDRAALRMHLKSRLPGYMVPAAIVVLKSLPLNHNGKLERSRLPAPDRAAYEAEGYEAPRTLTELTIVRIWAECLRIEPIGSRDNFFSLGGDSISAMRMLSSLKQAENINVDFPTLLRNPTPVQLAAFVSKAQVTRSASRQA